MPGIPGAPTEDEGEIRCGAAETGTLSLWCIDLLGLMGEVSREPFSPSLLSLDSRRLPAGLNSRELRLAADEIVAAAAAGGLGSVRREGGTREPSARRIGASVVRGPFVRVTSRVDMGCSKCARCEPDVWWRGAMVPNSVMLARASSFMLDAFDMLRADQLAVRLPAVAVFLVVGGGMLPPGSTGRETMRGILVGVAEGCGRESFRSELLDAAVLSAGEPWIDGRCGLGARAVPPLMVDSLRLDWAESRLLNVLSTEGLCLTALPPGPGGGIMIPCACSAVIESVLPR